MKKEQTLLILKPDAIQRSLVGETIARLERVGLKLVALKCVQANEETVYKHYTIDPEWIYKTGKKSIEASESRGQVVEYSDPEQMGNMILKGLQRYMTAGPIICMAWEGPHAVVVARKLVGGTEPRTSDVGTIRGDFVIDSYELANAEKRSVRNLIHASSSVEDAEKEIEVWFSENERMNYVHINEKMFTDVNLDGVNE